MSLPSLPTPDTISLKFSDSQNQWEKIFGNTFSHVIMPTLAWVSGIVTLGVIFYGGYRYISAGSDTKKAIEARQIIIGGVIGATIVVSAYTLLTLGVAVANALRG